MKIQAAILTDKQLKKIKGDEFAPDSYFAPFKCDSGEWCISQQEVEFCTEPNFKWVQSLPIVTVDYTPIPPPK